MAGAKSPIGALIHKRAPSETLLTGRRAQLDGLRVLAMSGVLYIHTWNSDRLFEWIRVSLFFILSGFLITAVLLAARDHGGRIKILNFYARRLLRLMPALFVLIIFGLIFDVHGFRETVFWHLFQASNLLFALQKDFRPWIATQLWSLNVLEAFYLLWPPVILMLSMTRIYLVTIAIFVSVVTLRVNVAAFGLDPLWWGNYVIAADPIATGAFFCLLLRVAAAKEVLLSRALLVASLALITSPVMFGQGWGSSESYRLLVQPALGVIVCGAYIGWHGPVGLALQSPPIRFLSRISYGVFVYHLAVWWLIAETWPVLYSSGPLTFAVVSAATIAVAWLSWVLLERPIARLKSYVPTALPNSAGSTVSKREQPT